MAQWPSQAFRSFICIIRKYPGGGKLFKLITGINDFLVVGSYQFLQHPCPTVGDPHPSQSWRSLTSFWLCGDSGEGGDSSLLIMLIYICNYSSECGGDLFTKSILLEWTLDKQELLKGKRLTRVELAQFQQRKWSYIISNWHDYYLRLN